MNQPQQETVADRAESASKRRVFVSYQRDAEPDERVALQIHRDLKRHFDVFIDKDIKVGEQWAERIQSELASSDFLIPFLSAESVHSEMVLGEIEWAHRLWKSQGRPAILPVRLAYKEPFDYPLSSYLNPINWAFWNDDADTSSLVGELSEAIGGGQLTIDAEAREGLLEISKVGAVPVPLAAAQPPPALELPEGTMDPHSAFYVERPVDEIARRTIQREGGVTLTIKGPRQMGKSSLLMRTLTAAAEARKRVAFLDFQRFDRSALRDADIFFRQFCTWLTDELEMEDRVEEHWQQKLGNSLLCTNYVRRYILKELEAPLVLAMDEVDAIFDSEFRTDFFSMLRSWHNERAYKPRWKMLDLALVTSTEPYQLIESLNQSPFNVGEILELVDFSVREVEEVNAKHGSPLSASDIQVLVKMLGGHPFLTRRSLYLVVSGRTTLADLEARRIDDRGPFGDHLRLHLFRLHGHDDLIECLKRVLRQQTCTDESLFWRLRGAGLVRREGDAVVPRCELYADYFRERLNV